MGKTVIVYKTTLRELQSKAGGVVWEWCTGNCPDDRYVKYTNSLYKDEVRGIIRSKVKKVMQDGKRENIVEQVVDATMDTQVGFVLRIDKGYIISNKMMLDLDVSQYDKITTDELKKLKWMKYTYSPYSKEAVSLEGLRFSTYEQDFIELEETIRKNANSILKNDYRYCTKKCENIIPDKYRHNIDEWIEINRKKHSNMERTIMMQMVRDKKDVGMQCASWVMASISGNTHRYRVPHLYVDGRYNKTMIVALQTELLKGKTKQDIIKMTKKDLLDMYKTYWKKELALAARLVDALTEEDVR